MGVMKEGNTLFLNVSCGFLVNKKKEISTRGYDDAFFMSIKKEEDVFEEKPMMKYKLHLKDASSMEEVVISFTAESWFAIGFFQRIEKIDVSKPFTVGVSKSDVNDKISFCWLRQSGQPVKKDETMPMPEKVKVGKIEVNNWEPFNEHAERVIAKLNSAAGMNSEVSAPTKDNFSEPQESDGLPF